MIRRTYAALGLGMLTGLSGCSDYEVIRYEGVDVWVQEPAAEVDVLLVVDNSCSMEPYQTTLSQNFDGFISFFLPEIEEDPYLVDYHIGVVTTDTNRDDAGEVLGQVLTTETDDAEEVFAEIVSLGTDGTGYEMGLHSAYLALTPPLSTSTNSTFLRDDAYLSVIFVSDEEDSSPLPVNDYINVFREVKGARSRDSFNASSLVVTDLDECGADSIAWGATEGTRYIDVAEQTGGILGSICADNFDDIVTDLSMATSRLTDTFYLSALPDASTLTLYVDDEEYLCEDGKWAYYLSEEDSGISYTARIVFEADYLPPPSSQITARYNYGSGGEDGFCSSGEDEESSEEGEE